MPLDALPQALALRIFALLPADARLLAAAVCRSWRAMLAERSLWTRLDLTSESGVRSPSDALLRAAAARAGGQLEVLRVNSPPRGAQRVLLAVLGDNAGTLRELVLHTPKGDRHPLLTVESVAALLHAAPGLHLLEACVWCTGVDVQRALPVLPLLRKEPPFGPLCLKGADLEVGWREATECLAVHTSLEVLLLLFSGGWPSAQADTDTLVGALLSLPRLRSLALLRPPPSVLARVLGCPALTSLHASGTAPLLGPPAVTALLCNALHANKLIVNLGLINVGFWRDMDAAAALLGVLQRHASLKTLALAFNSVLPEDAIAAGAALGALIGHSALHELDIMQCAFGDAGLGPLVDALSQARHLQRLNITRNDMSEAFARERLLPAVRACASLRELEVGVDMQDYGEEATYPAVLEAQALLQQRLDADYAQRHAPPAP